MIPEQTLIRLEFDKILDAVATTAHSTATKQRIAAMRPLSAPETITREWERVGELCALQHQGCHLRINPFDDIRPHLFELRPAGAVLTALQLMQFIPVLGSLTDLFRQLSPRSDIPAIQSLTPFPSSFADLVEPLIATFGPEGEILDSASRELATIRGAKRTLANRVRRKLEELVRRHETALFLQDDFITIRSGRWVIPVRMDAKGMVPGVVHDVSASGETAFMEPLEIIPFVNELENLSAEEKAEEIRIMRQLSGWIRDDAELIQQSFETLVELDRLDCIARYGRRYHMQHPCLSLDGTIQLVAARHPLLLALCERSDDARQVVPLDLILGCPATGDDTPQVVTISGPNAGGKTIALKTVGLLSVMALSGMPIPADPSTRIPLLQGLLVDIGDDQSIEQQLSTFSAHVAATAAILSQAAPATLVLLDELGTGTEPLQGAAIGSAVLEELRTAGAMVLATTHLTEIVGFVQQADRMRNAGMEFDHETWSPRYRLVMGEPGQSHALETAQRYGLPDTVIARARELLGSSGSAFSGIMEELSQKRTALEQERAAAETARREIEQLQSALERQRQELAEQQRLHKERANLEIREQVSKIRRELQQLIEQYRQDRRKETSELFQATATAIEEAAAPADLVTPPRNELAIGTTVYVRSLGREATIINLEPQRKTIRVRAGTLELEVPLSGLARATQPSKQKQVAVMRGPVIEQETSPDQLNLIGQRVDQALVNLEHFLDHSVLAGMREVRIIHGIGSGVLRQAVREALERHPNVQSFRPGEPHEGRDGATIVYFG